MSSSQTGMAWLTKQRYALDAFLGSDKYTYGDLYGISYLPKFKQVKDTSPVMPSELSTAEKDISLYVIGDSYFYSSFEQVPDYFERTKSLIFYKWGDRPSQSFKMPQDSTRKVLLIESVERNVLNIISLQNIQAPFEVRAHESRKSLVGRMNSLIRENLYHPTLEENLSFTLFDISVFSTFKSWKASFNQTIFGRSPSGVILSKSKDFLYLEQTVDSSAIGSSFKPVSPKAYSDLLQQMKFIESYAKSIGFDEVVFSFIPNPSSVLLTEGMAYNQFLPELARLAGHDFRVINPTQELSKNSKANFFHNDSHWNKKGAQIWLALLNEYLLSLPKK
jgi:hypothetical protein